MPVVRTPLTGLPLLKPVTLTPGVFAIVFGAFAVLAAMLNHRPFGLNFEAGFFYQSPHPPAGTAPPRAPTAGLPRPVGPLRGSG
jgi:hypothetical protein